MDNFDDKVFFFTHTSSITTFMFIVYQCLLNFSQERLDSCNEQALIETNRGLKESTPLLFNVRYNGKEWLPSTKIWRTDYKNGETGSNVSDQSMEAYCT